MLGIFALTSAAIFFGAAIYINLAEHPARLDLPVEATLAEWKPSYKRGLAMQASIAVVSGLCGLAIWWTSGATLWLLGALAILANWPFTLFVMMPVNHRLEATAPGSANPETRALLLRWGRLHAVRSALGGLATLLFMVASF
ncbi:MAG: DUF1772 domain-containing protein [Sphingomicrobium sp.]